MLSGADKVFFSILSLALIACTFTYGVCSVDVVIVRGRVDHAPNNAIVRVQLVYSRDEAADSGDVTIENGRFSIPIEFLTQSRRPVVNGLLEKCNRRPKAVIVTLVESSQGHEYDRVSLDFAKDFKVTDSGTYYTLRQELVLHGSR
jgi:hypothetical protein